MHFCYSHPLILSLQPSLQCPLYPLATDHESVDIDFRLRRTEWEFSLTAAASIFACSYHFIISNMFYSSITLQLKKKHTFCLHIIFNSKYVSFDLEETNAYV